MATEQSKLGVPATILFTLVAMLVSGAIGFVLANAFFASLDSGAALALPGIGVLQVSPKLQSWAQVLAAKYAVEDAHDSLLAVSEIVVIAAGGIGFLLGYFLRQVLGWWPSIGTVDLVRTHELWLDRMNRRWFAIMILAFLIMFEVLRVSAFYVSPAEAAPYFTMHDVWFDITPLVFSGFLLAQVALIRRDA